MNTVKTKVGTKGRKRQSELVLKKQLPLLTMMLPGAILTFMFAYMPIFGIILAFKKINLRQGILGSPWYGLKNFSYLFKSNDLWIMLRNTIGYNLIFIFFGMIFGVTLAILLSLMRQKLASKTYQTIFIMPHFLSMIIVSYIVLAFLNMENGFVNKYIMPFFGRDAVNWYVDKKPWPFLLVFVHFWKELGFGCIIYLSSIAGIDTQLYEAAAIDGAGFFKKLRHITLPHLSSLVRVMAIMQILGVFQSFEKPLAMTGGGPNEASTTVMMLTYNYMFSNGAMDKANALSVIVCLILIAGSIVYFKMTKAKD